MQIKGLEALQKHVPDMNSPLGVVRILLLPVLLFTLISAVFNNAALTAPPIWLLIANILLGSLGFLLLYLFFRYKKDLKARYGSLAYREAASRFGHPAVAIITAVIVRIRYLPGPAIPSFGWYYLLPTLGWVLVAIGALLSLRTVLIFGIDNLTMLYVYFPEESRLVNHRIYNLLRHPAYSAVITIVFGLALLNGNWFALACASLFALGLWGWVRLVEEQELIERFGQTYIEYRQHVPPFWPRLHDLSGFLSFLIAGR